MNAGPEDDEWDLEASAVPDRVFAEWIAQLNATSARDDASFDLDWETPA